MARKKIKINFRQRYNRAMQDPAHRGKVRNIRADALLAQLSRNTDARKGALQRLATLQAEADNDPDAPGLNLPPDIVAQLPDVTTTEDNVSPE
jgi:hypothetical protein